MRRLLTFLLIIGWIFTLFVSYGTVYAVPPLPSSFYGTVKFNGINLPEGTVVEALINGQVISQSQTMMYEGDSVYSIDVSGDDTSTTVVEGGKEGDVIQFRVGGLIAAETGLWESGTNVELNLSTTGSISPETPQPTNTSIPTQTSEVIPTQTPTNDRTQPAITFPTNSQATPQISKTDNVEKSTPTVAEPQETEDSNTINPTQTNEVTQELSNTPYTQTEAIEQTSDQEEEVSSLTVAMIALIIIAIIALVIYLIFKKQRSEF